VRRSQLLARRLLIIGVGSIGERHLRCVQRIPEARAAICEINDDLRHSIATKYEIAQVYKDLETAIRDGVDAAIICAPAHLHVPIAMRIVEASVHVLIEKPLSTTLNGVEQLRNKVLEKKVIAAVAYTQRTNPNLAAMRAALLAKKFGRPLQVIATSGQHFPFYRPTYRDTYYKDRATGGGAIQDALSHLVNAVEWLIGPMQRTIADAEHCYMPGVEVEDTVHVMARHANVLVTYALNQHQAPNEITITVVCEHGTLRCEFHENRWRWITEPGNNWHDELGPTFERDDLLVAQLQAFFDSIERGAPALCTLDEGIQTLSAIDAILRSLVEGRWTEPRYNRAAVN